ncbi:MAG TPA: TetR/AcrR family transcriptional regulator [Burkholderiales bacterium]|nr:TetR/AcrR family transcriptional regulator [Burkholderiales bacterium]
MKLTAEQSPAVRGRPRSFDRERALERAMKVFWRQGYEATSLSDLTAAMGVNPPSLYGAFGDKEKLFLEAVERYRAGVGSRDATLAEAPTARAAIEAALQRTARGLSGDGVGCMLVTSAVNCSVPRVKKALALHRAAVEAGMRKRIERGIRDGELPADTDAGGLAKFYETVTQGMSSQAMDGATRRSLLAVVATAMRAWPEKKKVGPDSA